LTQIFEKKNTSLKRNTTPPKINIEAENDRLEDVSPFPGGPYSQVPAVNLPGCIHNSPIVCIAPRCQGIGKLCVGEFPGGNWVAIDF